VVEQHGGALEFGPGPGARGTSFRFTLPAPRPTGALAASRGEAVRESGDT
jgi:two-component system sensor histidine kinase DctS